MEKKRHPQSPLIIIGISLVWFLIGWFGRGLLLPSSATPLDTTLNILENEALYQAESPETLQQNAIRGMLIGLGDPHAALLAPPVNERFDPDFAGETGMVGLSLGMVGGQIGVTHIFPGRPAEGAGLQVNDILLSVDDFTLTPLTSLTEVSYMVRGPVGEAVTLVIQRGEAILTFSPIREAREIVSAEMLTDQIGYLAQYTFTTNADELFLDALQELISQGAQGLIWDLRSNGGGSVQTAQQILSAFFDDQILYHVEFPDGSREAFVPLPEIEAQSIALVVLVGPNTYSAAEMSAAAIQDWSRGTVIGETTYGKGTIQNTAPISEDLLLQVSIAKWLSPDGRWYQETGLIPDIVIRDDPATPADEVLQEALSILSTELE